MSVESSGELPLWQDEAAQKILDDLSKNTGFR